MALAYLVAGIVLILGVLWEAFETIVLPRRVTRRFRWTRLFYRFTWWPWRSLARLILLPKRRDAALSIYGPLSLVVLLSVWAVCLILGFGLVHEGLDSRFTSEEGQSFSTDLYFSGTTFFTLGLGDVVPLTRAGRVLAVVEAGLGFGFLAIVIGYLPVLYQSFSRREVIISMLDARAGSPPTAAELVRRHAEAYGFEALDRLLHDWEQWAAELLESHLSYPVLAYFRSQHDNQSWLGALTALLDACALVMAGVEGPRAVQAKLTFAMARHAVVDLSQVFATAPQNFDSDRLSDDEFRRLAKTLEAQGIHLDEVHGRSRLQKLRNMYEPYVRSLSAHLAMSLPPWLPPPRTKDNWQTSAWEN
jgi:hypothetical protein